LTTGHTTGRYCFILQARYCCYRLGIAAIDWALGFGLLRTVNHGAGKGWESIEEECCITLHQEDSHPLVQMSDLLGFVLTSVSGQGGSQLLHLQDCGLMPAAQGLHWHGDEHHSSPPAPLTMFGHFLIVPDSQSMARSGGRLVD
jgi:hypothetical protein